MDVRQFAFLARQPSAAVKPRSSFLGLPKRGLALVLANAMFWQPLLAQADGIVVSAPGTTLGQAGNGVPIVNIAAPNGSGLSHNQFSDYNVGQQGVILNNATSRTQSTQLGGIILGNPNFNGSAANVILNEVNGGSPSQLRGYTEVAGQSAHVIVANPYGITCNGCGFINTPQATLTTGKAVIENGQVSRYQVDKGSVTIDGAGLNANNVDQFEIITRAATINAQIQAKKLSIVAGRNDVDARTLNATARAADGSQAPDLAIDSSALGGMYVGAVKLVGTESGVGVRLSGDMVAGGDIQIDTAGNVVMGQASAGTAIAVKAASVETQGAVYAGTDLSVKTQRALSNRQTLAARDSITLDAGGRLTNGGIIEAGINADNSRNAQGDVRLIAQAIDNSGKTVIASRDLTVNTGALSNQGGTLGSGQRLSITSGSLDNSHTGRLVSDGDLTVRIDDLLDNQTKGNVLAKGVMVLQAGRLDNRSGVVSANQNLNLHVGQVDNREGVLNSKQTLAITGQSLSNQGGLVSAIGPVRLTVETVNNSKGRIASEDELDATLGVLNQQGGELVAQGDLTLNAGTVDNRNGGLIAATKVLKLKADSIDNRTGEISSQQNLELSGEHLDNRGGKLLAANTLELAVSDVVNQAKGLVFAKDVRLTGTRLDNTDGTLGGQRSMDLKLSEALDNTRGKLNSEGSMALAGQRIDNTSGSISSAGQLNINTTADLLNNAGTVESAQGLTLTIGSLDNTQGLLKSQRETNLVTGQFTNGLNGRVISAERLDLTATQVTNNGRIASVGALNANLGGLTQLGGAELVSNAQLTLDLHNGKLANAGLINAPILLLNNLASIDNQNGEISSQNAFTLTTQNLNNTNGKLISNQELTLRVDQVLNNFKGLISGRGDVDISASELIDNQRGSVIADGTLLLSSATLDNRSGEIAGKAQVTVNADRFDNQKGQLISTEGLHVSSANLDNREGLVGAIKALKLDVDHLDNRAGEVTGNADVTITGLQLNNSDKGVVFSGLGLKLAVDQVINRTLGQLNGQRLTLAGTSLDNTGGKLFSQQPLMLTLAGDLDNSEGLLSSEGTLDVKAHRLNNTKGSLSSAQGLNVSVTSMLNNKSGELLTDGNLILRSADLDNEQGDISGKGPVSVTSGEVNNQGGRLNSGDTLSLTTAQLNNGGSIGSTKAMTASVTGLNQQGGKLFSNAGLSLDMNNGQLNNQDGLINAVGPLLLNNLTNVTNNDGEISSGQAFSLTAQNLDNSHGKLLSNQGLTLRIDQALTNIKGLIGGASLTAQATAMDNRGGSLTSRGDLQLTSAGLLNNSDQGLISAAQAVTVHSADLNNQSGTLLGAAVTLNAMALDNTASGLINSRSTLNLKVASLDSGSGGEVSAKGAMAIDLNALALAGGRIVGEQGITVDFNNNDLDNRNGLILANGPLTLKNLRNLSNQGGEISSQQSFTLAASALDNSAGKLISSQVLTLNADTLNNSANGLMSGWQGLNVSGGSLDNRNHGTLSSRNGAIDVRLSGALQNNTEGALVSQGRLDVSAASLDNRGKAVLSSGAGQHLSVTGALVNGDGSLIESGTTLDVQAATLANQATINAQQAFTFTGTDLTNNGGTLASNGQLTLDLLGNLNNSGGKLVSAGPLLLQRASQVYNDADGQIASQGLLTLFTGGLNNSERGTIVAKERVAITASDVVQNHTNGLIYSQDADVQLSAAGLNNAKGVVQGQTGLSLNIRGDVDNQGGTLASLKGLLDAQLAAGLNNQGGIIQAQRLNLLANSINNQGGRIAAQAGDAVLNANFFANTNGGVYAKGLVRVDGQQVDNSAGQIAGGVVELTANGLLTNRGGVIESDGSLNVAANSVDNQGGQIRALGSGGKTNFQIGGVFDNRNGRLETSNADLTLNVGGFQNQGGSLLHAGKGFFDIATANLTQAGGDVVTRGGLTLTADNWTNSSVIQAGRLTINVNTLNQTASGQLLASDSLIGTGGNWNNDGLITSDGTADLTLTGNYVGKGRYSSVGTLGLSAAQLNVSSAASIAGGGDTTLSIAGAFNNYGRVTSAAKLSVGAGAINNYATLGSTQALLLQTPTLLNEGGLIFSGSNIDIKVGDLLNNNNAAIYSLGNLSIGGQQGGKANSVVNFSSSIQSDADFILASTVFENKRQGVAGNERLVSGDITYECDGKKCYYMNYFVEEQYISEATFSGQAATVSVAGDFNADVGRFNNFASSIVSGGNIHLKADGFENTSVSTGAFTRSRVYKSTPGRSFSAPFFAYENGDGPVDIYVNRNSRYVMEYYAGQSCDSDGGGCSPNSVMGARQRTGYLNPYFGQGPEVSVPAAILALNLMSDVRNYQSSSSAAAVIQAGKTVSINATKSIQNGDIKNLAPFMNQGQQNGVAKPTTITKDISVNAQLPPDLAQRQVNPVTLPNFALPAGQNGLFRLSSSRVSDTQLAQRSNEQHSWDLGVASIDLAHREQGVPQNQGRTIQLGDASQIAVDSRPVSVGAREASGINAGSSPSLNIPGITPLATSTPGSGQTLNRVQGLPDRTIVSKPHKYLIETNPVLTELKQFMSSDYLLAGLGYNPDESAKRLGDGLYEQRLIQQAIVERTGQRFIDGQTSDEAVFRHLMDNAIRSKQALDLSVGVSLTGQQVAALTHDIVWLEENVINGEKVLVPVLYLAQADNRLAPNGALIAGQDVTLIAGENLENAGTLRATHNLSAKAGNDLTNSGLIEAGNRLDLLAGNNIVNKAGGIIAGRDVTLTAVGGDVINERSVTTTGYSSGTSIRRDYLDSAGRIEAANDLSLNAGRDVSNNGSVLASGRDTTIIAGRDVRLDAVEQRNSVDMGSRYRTETVTQTGASLDAGRDVKVTAGRDFSAIASRIDAKRDLSISAADDLSISSAADEQHSSSKSKKVTRSEDHISQVSSVLKAGGDVSLSAGKDLELTASRVAGGGNVALEAQRDLSILSALDEDASFYSKKSKGSFGRSKSEQRESYDSTNVASVVEAGKDLTVNASKKADGGMNIEGGRDVTVIGSQLKAGGDMLLGATGDIAVLSGVEEHGSYSKKTKSGFLGLSKSGKSQLKTTASQVGSDLEAGNDVVVAAGNDIRLRASEINAENDAELRAGLVKDTGDINLVSANDTAYSRSEKYEKKTGSISGGFIAISSAKKAGQEAQSSTSVGSQVMADRDATLQAERDINLVGSGISAGRDVSLNAGRDVNVVAAQNSKSERDWAKSKQTGIGVSSDANGVTFFAGTDRSGEKNRLEQQTAAASQISAGENLAIMAKRDINQRGSDLAADNDIDLKAGRNINIDAARERLLVEQQLEKERNGVSVSLNHNYGSTKDAVSGAGKGEDNVSKGSSTLRGVDAVGQFLAGPTGDLKIGSSSESTSKQVVEVTNRPSTLHAGKDLNMTAGNDVAVAGGQLSAGRDINVTGRDINLDVAKGNIEKNDSQSQSWAGIHGGTSGGAKLGIGGSHGVADEDASHETSTPTVVDAGRDINLIASHDLNLIGTQARSGRDIDLKAGNDLNIGAAKNESNSESTRSSGGGEVGLTLGGEKGAGIYVSVSMGKGDLEREKQGQQNAYLYAGDRLSFGSGRDTNIAGAELRGDQIIGRVGRDLSVSSVPDTGKVKGKEFDISATVTIGPGAGVSGSVGYGQTTGKTNWVEDQTRITGRDKVDIRTEDHTQLDGALIASDTGNLKLDTGTLGFNDIAGKDNEHGYYLSVGGSYKEGQSTTQDPSQVGKGKAGDSGWSVSGWKYDKEREQSVRATVGSGEIIVRDAADAASAVAGLNREVGKAYEVTRDKEKRTDLYITDSSLTAVTNPTATIARWTTDAKKLGDRGEETIHQLLDLLGAGAEITVGMNPDDVSKEMLGKALVRQLGSRHAEDRAALITKAIGGITGKEQAPENQALIDKLTQIAGDDPNKALIVMSLLMTLNGPKTGASNLVAIPVAAEAVVVAVGAVLVASDATFQEKARIAANSLVESGAKAGKDAAQQIRVSVAVWEILLGTSFPIHQLDPEHLAYITPILEINGANPSSGGFANGGVVNPATNTGGTQLDGQRDDGKYVTPEHRLDPGNMYNENANGAISEETSKLLGDANQQLKLYIGTFGKYKPPTVIGAVDPLTGKIVTSSSGSVPDVIAPELRAYAEKLGGLGVKTACGNTLGRCAEFRAANELLLNNPGLRLSDIKFTPAIRPRTGEVVPRCENCTNIFGAE